ncbi:UNKNOWN [Stylonychia lemnae]|uniref:Uncharacterized protein n=1 Tax=Stylonychia lemnae TaxID=5949 RepID=A0A078A013_STYLE|nr:UNKNOWN [Stylonychia lemnae]|eukprot:CDW74788.1 UNKNOWN [Stylonychia lemnae]
MKDQLSHLKEPPTFEDQVTPRSRLIFKRNIEQIQQNQGNQQQYSTRNNDLSKLSEQTMNQLRNANKRLTYNISYDDPLTNLNDAVNILKMNRNQSLITSGIKIARPNLRLGNKLKSQMVPELPKISDRSNSSPRKKLLGILKINDNIYSPKASEIQLNHGLSDMKKPYVPDFGYTNYMSFDEGKKVTWQNLANQILRYPQYEKMHRVLEERNEKYKKQVTIKVQTGQSIYLIFRMMQGDLEKLKDLSGMDRIRLSLRKWIFQKQTNQSVADLDKFHKKLMEFDKKYSGMKRDISQISSETETFKSYIQKIKATKISRIQLSSRNRQPDFQDRTNDNSILFQGDRSSLSKSLEVIDRTDIENTKKSRNPAINSGQGLLSQGGSMASYNNYSQKKIMSSHTETQKSPVVQSYFSVQKDLVNRRLQRLSLQQEQIDSRVKTDDKKFEKLRKQFNDWLRYQQQSQQKEGKSHGVDYLDFIRERQNSQELGTSSTKNVKVKAILERYSAYNRTATNKSIPKVLTRELRD